MCIRDRPCAAKKLAASRRTIRSDVDFVLTFEEVMGMFEAKAIKFSEVAAGPELVEAPADGRGFAVSGGVANAVVNAIHKMDPDREVKVMAAQGPVSYTHLDVYKRQVCKEAVQ